jgi:hypothetical protein
VRRNPLNLSRNTVMLLYVGAGAVGGALAGGALGWLGSLLEAGTRLAAITAAGVAGLVLAVAALRGRWRPVLQCDIETPQRWVFQGAPAWSLKNGLALGFGMFTRLGFVLWYAIPVGALCAGGWIAGAAVYGTYATARTGGAAVIWSLGKRRGDVDPIIRRLEDQHPVWQTVASLHLLLLSGMTITLVGF